jgi:hypothetical protein
MAASCLLSLAACRTSASEADAVQEQEHAKPEVVAPEPMPEAKMVAAPGEPLKPSGEVSRVELPPTPTYEPPVAPARYEDGSYSVFGLRQHPDLPSADKDGEELILRAWIREIYMPPRLCELCPEPYVWVADGPDVRGHRDSLMVSGFMFAIDPADAAFWRGEPNVVLEVGKQYRIRGNFVLMADGDVSDGERGVFQFRAYEQVGADGQSSWVMPPNAHWNPKTTELWEKQNREMQEQMLAEERRRKGDRSR